MCKAFQANGLKMQIGKTELHSIECKLSSLYMTSKNLVRYWIANNGKFSVGIQKVGHIQLTYLKQVMKLK